MRKLVSQRGSHASPQECWQVFRASALHNREGVRRSWDEMFHPSGYNPRGLEVILEWVDGMARDAAQELSEAFAEHSLLTTQLQAAGHRARDAISVAAWLFYMRERASSSNPELLRRGD